MMFNAKCKRSHRFSNVLNLLLISICCSILVFKALFISLVNFDSFQFIRGLFNVVFELLLSFIAVTYLLVCTVLCFSPFILPPQLCGCSNRLHEKQNSRQVLQGEASYFKAISASGILSSQACPEDPQISSVTSG